MRKSWDDDEIKLLYKLFEENKSIKEIGLELGRTYESINKKLKKLNLSLKNRWDDAEIKKLIELHEKGVHFTKMLSILNRTEQSVYSKMKRLGLHSLDPNKQKFINNEYISKYEKYDWKLIQEKYNEGLTTYQVFDLFKISERSLYWAKNNNKFFPRNQSEANKNSYKNGNRKKSLKENIDRYRQLCLFKFSLNDYPDKFDFSLIEKYGWYKAKNRGNNLEGVSRDHMFSVYDGYKQGILPYYISHPANCQLLPHKLNNVKKRNSSITFEELLRRIEEWNKNMVR